MIDKKSNTKFNLRKNYGRIKRFLDIPDLIEIQKRSYREFLQSDIPPDERENIGLQKVFKSVFPIFNYDGTASLEFVQYSFDEPKYDIDECRVKGLTYAAPMKITLRLIIWDLTSEEGHKEIRDIKEQEIYFGEMALITPNGTFIINGTERVVVSQLHRSPGAFFDQERGLYTARIIPYRGSWLDFEFDQKDLIYVRIDRRRKFPVTILLKALGYSASFILNYFYPQDKIIRIGNRFYKKLEPQLLLGTRATANIIDPTTKKVLLKKGRKFTKIVFKRFEELGIDQVLVSDEEILGRITAYDIINPDTGEVFLKCNQGIDELTLERLKDSGIEEFSLVFMDKLNYSPCIHVTLMADKVMTQKEAIMEIHKKMRPGEPQSEEIAYRYFENLFFSPERYDLSKVGALKLNSRLGLSIPLDEGTLRREDILAVVRYLFELRNGKGHIDDIDHLGNRRTRSVGELLENQFRIGLLRLERAVRERMSIQEVDTLMPHDLINIKPVTAAVKEFFGSSQLSQFMDQINPLAEVTHKRRLSALGPGGLTRERAGFEVRDVHPTHYGRICPVETPEGQNIGLIVSLSTYARTNEFGFIETPYRVVKNGKVSNEIKYLSALEEEKYTIAQANAPVDENGRFTSELLTARKGGEFSMVYRDEVGYMDVSPNQLVSVAASLIPFLENDDANRALMGSNMQRQAVPLIHSSSPLIGTGMEEVVARDSGSSVIARRDGVIEYVDADRIVVRAKRSSRSITDSGVDIYRLLKFRRSNQNTCLNQKPCVEVGQRVTKDEVLADGPATDRGELALGQNVTVAFMIWGGYNFEDSILVSERLVREDVFTSIHIEEFEVIARDTKLGMEEITKDIPNVGEEALKDLDESGIIRIGAEVKTGDILVGKVTPKSETQLSPEERLLKAIFGDKGRDVKDTSLRVPSGITGTVMDAKVFTRKDIDKDARALSIEEEEEERLKQDRKDEERIIRENGLAQLREIVGGKTATADLKSPLKGKKSVYISKGEKITMEKLKEIPIELWSSISVGDGKVEEKLKGFTKEIEGQMNAIKVAFDKKIARIRGGDELPPGVIKIVKVFLAVKRKLSIGDKMAGRHGNKGVISRILPEEDMPYLPDGSPVDIVLNPLGVPSRMNMGQVLETHLGWAAKEIGEIIDKVISTGSKINELRQILIDFYKGDKETTRFLQGATKKEINHIGKRLKDGVFISSPVFDGANEEDIREALRMAGLPESGQTTLYDGRTGDVFHHNVTVGTMYMMKLHHLVDDKIHARSTGPYSLVTQQPLGGKAQFGGQRLGEMEVWAMEAYGSAYSLQEFLTVKSDDVGGRNRIYEAIVKGKNVIEPGLPESFNVLIKELMGLGLNVELKNEEGKG